VKEKKEKGARLDFLKLFEPGQLFSSPVSQNKKKAGFEIDRTPLYF
jgi:hypothetical protein